MLKSELEPSVAKRNRGSRSFDVMDEISVSDNHKPTAYPEKENKSTVKTSCVQNLRYYFCEFCDNTSIHGFKFLGQTGRYLMETLWWLLVVCVAIACSNILIYKSYRRWVTNPVIVTFATTETPIWNIPFPAVTICPEIKVDKNLFDYSGMFAKAMKGDNLTKTEDDLMEFFSLVCDGLYEVYNDLVGGDAFVFYSNNDTIDPDTLKDYMFYFADTTTISCRWLGKTYNCSDILSEIYTSEGKCITFNMLSAEDLYTNPEYSNSSKSSKEKIKKWSLEKGYPLDGEFDAFPRRTLLSGKKAGFQIDLFADEEQMDYLCGQLQGFKVVLHHPAEEPDMDKHFRVPVDQAVMAAVLPKMITTADDIGSYNPGDRKCYLPGEKILSLFKIYTQKNCLSECFVNHTIKICRCTPFYTSYNITGRICGFQDRFCMERAKVSYLQNDVKAAISNSEVDIPDRCKCLPSCTSLEFDAETSQTDFHWKKFISTFINNDLANTSFETGHVSRLIVYYKEQQFMTSERHELHGLVDFLGNCGGLLGLFCGFSFTSSMEILYYLTLRLFCNIKKFGKRYWSGSPEVVN